MMAGSPLKGLPLQRLSETRAACYHRLSSRKRTGYSSCTLDARSGHDPEKLQTFRIRSCAKQTGSMSRKVADSSSCRLFDRIMRPTRDRTLSSQPETMALQAPIENRIEQ